MIRRIGFVALLLLTVASGLPAQESTAELADRLGRATRLLEGARRVLVALRSSDVDFMMTPIADDSRLLPSRYARDPDVMQLMARRFKMQYENAWDRNPEAFYERAVAHLENMARDLTRRLEASRYAEQTGTLPVPRDTKGRPVITDSLISRFLRAQFSSTQTGAAPWKGGNFTKFDYEDISKRIEWARSVKRSQGGATIVSTPAMREQFSDEEVVVLNRRWQDLENAQNGRWTEVNW